METKTCRYCKSTYTPEPKPEPHAEDLARIEREKQKRQFLIKQKRELKQQIKTFSGSRNSTEYTDLLERFYKLFT